MSGVSRTSKLGHRFAISNKATNAISNLHVYTVLSHSHLETLTIRTHPNVFLMRLALIRIPDDYFTFCLGGPNSTVGRTSALGSAMIKTENFHAWPSALSGKYNDGLACTSIMVLAFGKSFQ